MHNKKATIGATMTWVVATIIILFVVILFVYASGVLAGSEWAKNLFKVGGSAVVGKTSSAVDSEQMLLALLQTEINGKDVEQYFLDESYDELKEKINPIMEKLPDVSGGYCNWYLEVKKPGKLTHETEIHSSVKIMTSWKNIGFFKESYYILNNGNKVSFFLRCPKNVKGVRY